MKEFVSLKDKKFRSDVVSFVSFFGPHAEPAPRVAHDGLLVRAHFPKARFLQRAYEIVAGDQLIGFAGKPLMEIDFLIRKDRKVVPVEAKSGKSFAVKSLHNFKDKFTNRVGLQYVLHDGDIQRDGEIVYLPYYMASVL